MSKRKTLDYTTEQVDAIQSYLSQISDLLGLQRWDIYVAAERAPKGARASVLPVEGRALAGVSFAQTWLSSTPQEMRNDIVHELLHVVHRDQTDLIANAGAKAIDAQGAYDVLWEAFRLATEVMVDHLTSIIAPSMPLPDFTGIGDTPARTITPRSTDTTEDQ